MRVKDVMTSQPLTCTSDTTVAEAGQLMWDGDCGVLPVLREGVLEGVITDRDMFIALATRNVPAMDLTVGQIATQNVVTCSPDDDVHQALTSMKSHRVRRLPVVARDGAVLGVVSMNDLLLASSPGTSLNDEQVIRTLQSISQHTLVPMAQAAVA